ncbi:MAG TPA: hypothetical protein VIL35_13230 [Vicinamibacterales bacterium]
MSVLWFFVMTPLLGSQVTAGPTSPADPATVPSVTVASTDPAAAQEAEDISIAKGRQAFQDVQVAPQIAFAGRDVRTTVRINRNAAYRSLMVSIDGPEFFASTLRQLDGEMSAATHVFQWKALPAGEYRLEAVIRDDRGMDMRTFRTFTVRGPEGELDGLMGPGPQQRPTGRRRGRR